MNYDITEKAMLASLHISQWCARKCDKQVSKEVNDKYGGSQEAGRFNKVLATKESLKEIQAAVGCARTFHMEQTLPWGERGERLLPSKNYTAYNRQMRAYKGQFEAAVDAFVGDYHTVIFEAKQTLGGLFNREDYPDSSEIREKFEFRTVISPVPTGQDFRVSLAKEEITAIQKDIEKRLDESNAAATRDLWQRLYELVGHMVERLSDPEAIFRDTLIGNIVRMTELLPRLNLYDDPQLEAMRRKIEASLCAYTPTELRCDKEVRQKAADDAKAVLDAMAGYVEAKEAAA
jgi:hypothetical protein